MRPALAVALLASLTAHAEVTSKAGPPQIVSAGANPRRVLKLAPPRGPEKLRLTSSIEQKNGARVPVSFEMRATPSGNGAWNVTASGMSFDAPTTPPGAKNQLHQVESLIAKSLAAKFRSTERGRLYDFEWTIPDGGDGFEHELRLASADVLEALGQMLLLLGEVLPAGSVGPGAIWSFTTEVRKSEKGGGATMTGVGRYELASMDEHGVTLRITARLSVPPIESKGEKVAVTGDLTGAVRIDPDRPLPASIKVETVLLLDVSGKKSSMHTTGGLELER